MEEKLKILHIAPLVWHYYRYRDQELPMELASRGHEVIYLNPVRYRNWETASSRLQNRADHDIPEGVKVIERYSTLPKSVFSFLHEIRDNVRQIRMHRPDAVICTDHLMGRMACNYCRKEKIPFIFDITDDWGEVDRGLLTSWYWKKRVRPALARKAGAIVSASQRQAEYFRDRHPLVQVVPNGKPEAFIRQIESAALDPSAPHVNFIASLRDWYDYDLMTEAFGAFPELELRIYGSGPMEGSIREKAAAYPNIHVMGNAPQSALPALLKSSLFGIIPLRPIPLNDSTCPVKLFDYWAASKAVIACPGDEIRRIAGDSIIYATQAEEMKAAIRLLLDRPALRESLGKTGLEKINSLHNYRIIGNTFLELIRQLKNQYL